MAHFRKKPVVVEAITFDQFIEFGKLPNPESVHQGRPSQFDYKGYPVTHENDECYLIPTSEGIMRFTPQDVLITGVNGEIYSCKIDIFRKTYESADKNFNSFGQALIALKEGKRVSRLGWNGKGMFLVQAGGYSVPLDKLREGTHFSKEFLESEGCTEFKIVPHIDMWAADKTYVTGWLASQTDMQATDWCILD